MSNALIERSCRVETDADGICTIAMDMKDYPTNLINPQAMQGLGLALEAALTSPEVKGIVLTSDRKEFMVGADLNFLLSVTDPNEIYQSVSQLNQSFRRLETGGKPVVAALNGTALGGGLELALACHYRVALNDNRIQLGLPEVQLGVFPGGGGTQRLPRLLGIQPALEYLLQAKRVRPSQAKASGIVHELAETPQELLEKAKAYIRNGGTAVQLWDQKGYKVPGGDIFSAQGGQVMTAGIALLRKETYGNYPGAYYCISAVYEGLQLPMEQALDVEARYFTKALGTKEAKHMIRTLFFHLNEANKGVMRPKAVEVPKLTKVGMLGAGMMGAGIAYVSAEAGMQVVLKDVSPEVAQKGKDYSKGLLDKKLSKKHITAEEHAQVLERIVPTAQATDLQGADLVIEAVFEDRSLKAQVTREAEAQMNPKGVFASNTSTLPITGLAQASQRPENFIGLHFFSPVDKMPLVEIILGEQTSDYALAMAIDYVLAIRKTPIVVRDGRGFFTSRVFATYVNEGMELLLEGTPPALVENAGRMAGMPVGPLALADEVSLSLLHHIVKQTEADLGVTLNHAAAQMGRLFVDRLDRVGKKAGKGFYEYPTDGKKYLWPGLKEHFPVREGHPDVETIRLRYLSIQALETARCLQEGIVREPKDADVGSIMGWGFAPYTGGAASYVDYVGLNSFIDRCRDFEQRFGARFAVPDLLLELQRQGKTGYYA